MRSKRLLGGGLPGTEEAMSRRIVKIMWSRMLQEEFVFDRSAVQCT